LPAADIDLTLGETTADYRDEIEIRTKGVARWFTNFRGGAVSEGRLLRDGSAMPSRYDVLYTLRKRHDSRISLHVVERNGAAITERGPGDTSRKPPLAEIHRRNVVDPVAALAFIRQELRIKPHTVGRRFSIPVYDGARRFDALSLIMPSNPGILRLALSLRPIAGFKGETSEDGDPDDGPRDVEIDLTDDDRLLPVYVRVSIAYLPLVVRLDHLCPGRDRCGR
jgi:hypothetical protein